MPDNCIYFHGYLINTRSARVMYIGKSSNGEGQLVVELMDDDVERYQMSVTYEEALAEWHLMFSRKSKLSDSYDGYVRYEGYGHNSG
jgi:hypothetical protein